MNIQLASVIVVACLRAPTGDGPQAATPEESKPGKIELRTAEVTVPLHWFGKKPVVDVRINGHGPYRLFLDTGAQGSVLDQDLTDELKLPVLGKARVSSPGGKGLPAKQVRLDRLEVGAAVLSAVPAIAFDRSHLYAAKDAPRGVLSAGIFPGFLVTLDYPQSKLLIRRGQLPIPDGASVFAYDAKRPLPEIRLSVAGQEVNVHLDSGAPGGITLPLKMAEHLPLASRPVEVARGKRVDQEVVILGAKLNGSVKVGRYVVENPELRFQDIPNAPGHVGYEFLRRFAVTIDAANHRLQLEEKPDAPKNPDKPADDARESAAQNERAQLRRIVDECNRRSIEAFKKGDLLAVARDYADDATIYFPRGQQVHGRQAIDRYWMGIKGAKDWKLETIEVGGTREAIYEVGKSTLTTVVDGKESTYVCNYVVIWKPQKDGRYRAHTDIFN